MVDWDLWPVPHPTAQPDLQNGTWAVEHHICPVCLSLAIAFVMVSAQQQLQETPLQHFEQYLPLFEATPRTAGSADCIDFYML